MSDYDDYDGCDDWDIEKAFPIGPNETFYAVFKRLEKVSQSPDLVEFIRQIFDRTKDISGNNELFLISKIMQRMRLINNISD